MRVLITYIFTFALLISLSGMSLTRMREIYVNNTRREVSSSKEVLYLPNGYALGLISFGYRNALANTLWFNLINYFGKHYRSDRTYQWLNHMCNLVSDLNPKMQHVYEFCGLMLAWEANLAQQAHDILSKGILNHPNEWRLFYLRGMTSLLFLDNEDGAHKDLVVAGQLPGAHPIIKTLAAKKISILDNSNTAKEFLLRAIDAAESDFEKQILFNRLQELENKNSKLNDVSSAEKR